MNLTQDSYDAELTGHALWAYVHIQLQLYLKDISVASRRMFMLTWKHNWTLRSTFQVDKDFIPSLMYIRDNEATAEEFEAMTLPFTVPNASGQDIQLSSKYSHITLENRAEYVRLAINYRSENRLII